MRYRSEKGGRDASTEASRTRDGDVMDPDVRAKREADGVLRSAEGRRGFSEEWTARSCRTRAEALGPSACWP